MKIESISKLELASIKALLAENKLPIEDISSHISFFGVKNNEDLIGVFGLEIYGNSALLRSLAVVDDKKGTGLGKKLCSYALDYLNKRQVKKVFLLTTTAKHFFIKSGFEQTDRAEVPGEILNTSEFSSICPASADCLVMELY